MPKSDVTSLGSAIFAFLAAGTFRTVEEAQDALCPEHTVIAPQPAPAYEPLYALYKKLYFSFGTGDVLAELRRITRGNQHARQTAN